MKSLIKKILPKIFLNLLIIIYENIFCKYFLPFIRFGLKDGLKVIRNWNTNRETTLKLNSLGVLYFRKNLSDKKNFLHIFIKREYKYNYQIEAKNIIDGGAYIGFSSLFFAKNFINAKVIAVEPDLSNYEILKKNVAAYKNIYALRRALWYEEKKLFVKDIGLDKWGLIVSENDNENNNYVMGITIEKIMIEFRFDLVDILKIDIEGSEKELFSKNYENWLPKVKYLIIEFHDRIKPGCTELVRKILKNYGFEENKIGQNHLFVNRNLIT